MGTVSAVPEVALISPHPQLVREQVGTDSMLGDTCSYD